MSKPKFYDCLKYWKVIREWTKRKYNISHADLEMLLFLYSEGYFSKSDFLKFANIIVWDRHRFSRMQKEGWIEMFRPAGKNTKAMYNLSYKSKRMISSLYEKLSGQEIPENSASNKIFNRNVKYTDAVYRNFIIEMNKERQKLKLQQLHHAPE